MTDLGTPAAIEFSLARDTFGRLVATFADGTTRVGVTPVRAFPISAPTAGFALLDTDGHELAWVTDLANLAPDVRA